METTPHVFPQREGAAEGEEEEETGAVPGAEGLSLSSGVQEEGRRPAASPTISASCCLPEPGGSADQQSGNGGRTSRAAACNLSLRSGRARRLVVQLLAVLNNIRFLLQFFLLYLKY